MAKITLSTGYLLIVHHNQCLAKRAAINYPSPSLITAGVDVTYRLRDVAERETSEDKAVQLLKAGRDNREYREILGHYTGRSNTNIRPCRTFSFKLLSSEFNVIA